MFAVAQHSELSHELFRKVYATYRSIYADLIREIDPTASARECLVRATLIAAQLEGEPKFAGLGPSQTVDDRVGDRYSVARSVIERNGGLSGFVGSLGCGASSLVMLASLLDGLGRRKYVGRRLWVELW